MAANGTYTVRLVPTSISTAITVIQIATPATTMIEILRAQVTQNNLTASGMIDAALLRKSGAATVTSFTPIPLREKDAAALCVGGTTATGVNASGEGTDGNVIHREAANVLNGWLWIPTIEERVTVAPSSFIALKFIVAPAAGQYEAEIVFREL